MRRLDLPLEPSSPSRARHFVRGVLGDWDVGGETTEDAALLVTELVTNAIIHARTSVQVVVDRTDSTVEFSVTDSGPGVIRMEEPRPDSVTGRGIFMLDQIAAGWAVITGDGPQKTVRFSLPLSPARTEASW